MKRFFFRLKQEIPANLMKRNLSISLEKGEDSSISESRLKIKRTNSPNLSHEETKSLRPLFNQTKKGGFLNRLSNPGFSCEFRNQAVRQTG
jgi:hypothetical protein